MSKVQVIRNEKDEPIYAVLPWTEYENLKNARSQDDGLVERGMAARGDEKFPAAVARRLVAGEVPLKVIREWRGLSQSELGALAKVAPQYISQIERGARNMGPDTANKLAPLLGVSTRSLLDDEEVDVATFAIGQRYRSKRNPSHVAEVVQLDPASNGWRAWVDVRIDGKLQQSDWVNFAQFSGNWSRI